MPLFRRLPLGSGNFTRYHWRGWELVDEDKSHLEMGDVFVVITPGRDWPCLCNAEALVDVFPKKDRLPPTAGDLWYV